MFAFIQGFFNKSVHTVLTRRIPSMFAIGMTFCLTSGHAFAQVATSVGCPVRIPKNEDLLVRDGYVKFIDDQSLAPMLQALPETKDESLNAALSSSDTMWYDEPSMIFSYQDSVETVVGHRANCVGRDVGERNRDNPGIALLMDVFDTDYKFRFPFKGVAGADRVSNLTSLNFWLPPKDASNKVLPVRWWKLNNRGRWLWVFPVGTMFGEVLYQKSPNGRLYVFEIRTRTRYLDGWSTQVFRPYASASELASAIKEIRPTWSEDPRLSTWVKSIEDKNRLKSLELKSSAFGSFFPPLKGAIDPIPAINNPTLIEDLLTLRPFKSVNGRIWKENDTLETYAPGSEEDFSIVPKGYEMGLIPANEESCTRCHLETGRPIKDANFRAQLYGEVWGEDRIFTWHLFQVTPRIFGTFDDADSPPSRQINKRMVKANLLLQGAPKPNDPIYRSLPIPYKRHQ